jgi:hypothetical protein
MMAVLCVGVVATSFAQQDSTSTNPKTNRRGIELLPKTGDFALGIEATPFLNYLGGFMGGNSTDKAPVFTGFKQTLYGKYFLSSDRAIRAKLALNFTQSQTKQTVDNDHARIVDPTNIAATTIDTRKQSVNSAQLHLGYEFRRGKGRVQGFYGGEIVLSYGKISDTFQYGNPITSNNQTPTTHNGAGAYGGDWNNLNPGLGYRILENRGGASFGAGVGAFVGVEYFFCPQISVGGELNLSFIYGIRGQGEIKSEGFLDNTVKEYNWRARAAAHEASLMRATTAAANEFATGSIFLMFHF